ncbi:MAG TPA: hypothetical protein VGN05_14600 [Parvibaculum sp.]
MKSFETSAVLCIAFALPLLGCAPEKAADVTPTQSVMDAQYTAKAKTPPMDAAEADAIYKNYIDNIGKPVRPTSGMNESSTTQ